LTVGVDRSALLGALANLAENAIKFNRAQTGVLLEALERNGQVLIEVHDKGKSLESDLG
jgi:signal transduction histidine kinase